MQNDAPNSEIIIYEGDSGQPSIEVRIEGETVWLTQATLAELFKTSRPNITMHINNIFQMSQIFQGPCNGYRPLTVFITIVSINVVVTYFRGDTRWRRILLAWAKFLYPFKSDESRYN